MAIKQQSFGKKKPQQFLFAEVFFYDEISRKKRLFAVF